MEVMKNGSIARMGRILFVYCVCGMVNKQDTVGVGNGSYSFCNTRILQTL